MKQADIQQAAEGLYAAEKSRQPIDPVSLSHPDMNIDDGYSIQKQWVDKKIADGRKVVGYKIGYTSRAMQKALNINEPDYGVLLDDMVFADGGDIEASQFCDPRIEMELAFILKDRLEGENVSVFGCAQRYRLRCTSIRNYCRAKPSSSPRERLHPKGVRYYCG